MYRRNMLLERDAKQLLPGVHVGALWDQDAAVFSNVVGLPVRYALIVANLVWELKQADLWNSIRSLFPMVGLEILGAYAQIVDLKNPLAAVSSVAGGWTYGQGAQPNGTNAVQNTGLLASTLTANSHHLAYYSRTQSTATGFLMGVNTNFNTNPRLSIYFDGTNWGFRSHSNVLSVNAGGATTGFIVASRTSNTDHRGYRNGSQIGSTDTTATSGNYPTGAVYLAAINQGNSIPTAYTDKECAFASIGDGLTAGQVATYYEIVQRYQVALNRAV